MQRLRHHVHDPTLPRAPRAPRLLRHVRQRIRLVRKPQLALGVFDVPRVEKDPALQQVPVKIGHQRTHITQAVALPQHRHRPCHPRFPTVRVALVHAVARDRLRDPDPLMRQQEISRFRIQRESVHLSRQRQHQHRARSVDRIDRRHLFPARPQQRLRRDRRVIPAPVDPKDRPDRHRHIDVRRPIHRVEHRQVAMRRVVGDVHHLLQLLAGQRSHPPALPQHVHERGGPQRVQPRHDLALHVDLVRVAQHPAQRGLSRARLHDPRAPRDRVDHVRQALRIRVVRQPLRQEPR